MSGNSLNLARLADRFEDAAAAGRGRSLDRMIDRLARKIQFPDGAQLEELNGKLDRLGKTARELGSRFDGDNELIQRLRSAVLANADSSDGLKTALGDVPPEELIEEARDLSARLRDAGQHEEADAVDAAIGELEKLVEPKGWEPPGRSSQRWQDRIAQLLEMLEQEAYCEEESARIDQKPATNERWL